jgi:hypothetical protein
MRSLYRRCECVVRQDLTVSIKTLTRTLPKDELHVKLGYLELPSHDDYRDRGGATTCGEFAKQRFTTHSRQAKIEHDEIRSLIADVHERVKAIGRDLDPVSGFGGVDRPMTNVRGTRDLLPALHLPLA